MNVFIMRVQLCRAYHKKEANQDRVVSPYNLGETESKLNFYIGLYNMLKHAYSKHRIIFFLNEVPFE